MHRTLAVGALMAGLLATASAVAGDVKTFFYNAQGRLVTATRATSAPGSFVGYGIDPADNRSQRMTLLTPLPAVANSLQMGEYVEPSQTMASPNGKTTLTLQPDGILTLTYKATAGSTPVSLWTSGVDADGQSILLYMTSEGALLVYHPASPNVTVWGVVSGYAGARMVIEDSCRMVIYGSGTTVLWTTSTVCPA